MRIFINISIIGLLLVSCVNEQTSKTGDGWMEKTTVIEEKANHQLDQNEKSHLIETKEIVKSEAPQADKIEQERIQLIESTKRIILQNQSIPSIKVDSMVERFEKQKNYYFGKTCNPDEYEALNQYSIEFNNEYPNSSKNTGEYDGNIFCLKKLDKPNIENSIIVFGRNEGGHTSDVVTLITINNEAKRIYYLPLSYSTGWDGHQTEVKSTIEHNKISREIDERYGWSNLHPDSLSKQPRRVITQEIIVKENGNMQVLRENVTKFNINELFK